MEPAVGVTVMGISVMMTARTLVTMVETMYPRPMPMIPPRADVVPASTTNRLRIVLSLAPSALRMPISRVRSVTETIMMFMMPMPPTSSEMAAMAVRTVTTMLTMLVIISSISLRLMTI